MDWRNKLNIQNIANIRSNIYLFIRNQDLSLKIEEIKDFMPFYYEPSPNGKFLSYDNVKLDRIYCSEPSQIKERRSSSSYESDILYTKRYLLEKIPQFTKSPTVKCFFDIEVPSPDEFPNPENAKYPISTIRAWDNKSNKLNNFYIKDLKSEYNVIQEFVNYLKKLQPDLLIAWNIEGFDYPYLCGRYPEFPQSISPINQSRYGNGELWYPSGISVIDLLGLFHKFTLGKKESYALMNIGHEELNYELEEDIDFTDLDKCYEKCGLDVMKMVELDKKYALIDTFNEIRILTTCLWEDLPPKKVGMSYQSNNSKPLDMLFLREAKKLGIVLPKKETEFDEDLEKIQGAYRQIFAKGVFKSDEKNKVWKVDLSSAYPSMLRDFCLDSTTVSEEPIEDAIKIDIHERETGEYKCCYWYKQNSNAIIPTVARKLLTMKDDLKSRLNSLDKNSEEYNKLDIQYASLKSVVNSLYGILANRYFRLFDNRIAETTTYLVRDVLHYIEKKVEKSNCKVIYVDTDSVFYVGEKDLTENMNIWIQEWAMDKYENPNVSLEFSKEGYFEKLFILALCRYIGYVRSSKGVKKEIKGVQMKRKDANPFIKKFQEELIEKLFENPDKKFILKFIENKIKDLKKQSILDIAFPCKMSKSIDSYKKDEIYLRALRNRQEGDENFQKKIGEKFFWVYIENDDIERNVIAIDKQDVQDCDLNLNWPKMMERNVFNIVDTIFDGMGWGLEFLELAEKHEQKLSLDERRTIIEQYKNESNYLELREKYKIKDKRIKKCIEEPACAIESLESVK